MPTEGESGPLAALHLQPCRPRGAPAVGVAGCSVWMSLINPHAHAAVCHAGQQGEDAPGTCKGPAHRITRAGCKFGKQSRKSRVSGPQPGNTLTLTRCSDHASCSPDRPSAQAQHLPPSGQGAEEALAHWEPLVRGASLHKPPPLSSLLALPELTGAEKQAPCVS